jgi:hypothetical protein
MSKSKHVTISDVFILFYKKILLAVARLLHITTSDVLTFIDSKFYFYHSYY